MVPVRHLGPFRIAALIGSGRRSDAFLASHDHIEGPWLVRELHPSGDRSAFERDAARSAELDGAPIVEGVTDIDGVLVAHSRPVMGELLSTLLEPAFARRAPLDLRVAFTIALGIASKLGSRASGRVHGDLAPHHVLLGYDGSVHLVDPAGQEDAAERMRAPGREGYRSPEHVLERPLAPASDVFMLGVLLYEMTTGTRLFDRPAHLDNDAAIAAGRHQRPRTIVGDHYPIELQVLLRKMLRPEVDDRFPDGPTVHEALRLAAPPDRLGEGPAELGRCLERELSHRLAAWRAAMAATGNPLPEVGFEPEGEETNSDEARTDDHPAIPRPDTTRGAANLRAHDDSIKAPGPPPVFEHRGTDRELAALPHRLTSGLEVAPLGNAHIDAGAALDSLFEASSERDPPGPWDHERPYTSSPPEGHARLFGDLGGDLEIPPAAAATVRSLEALADLAHSDPVEQSGPPASEPAPEPAGERAPRLFDRAQTEIGPRDRLKRRSSHPAPAPEHAPATAARSPASIPSPPRSIPSPPKASIPSPPKASIPSPPRSAASIPSPPRSATKSSVLPPPVKAARMSEPAKPPAGARPPAALASSPPEAPRPATATRPFAPFAPGPFAPVASQPAAVSPPASPAPGPSTPFAPAQPQASAALASPLVAGAVPGGPITSAITAKEATPSPMSAPAAPRPISRALPPPAITDPDGSAAALTGPDLIGIGSEGDDLPFQSSGVVELEDSATEDDEAEATQDSPARPLPPRQRGSTVPGAERSRSPSIGHALTEHTQRLDLPRGDAGETQQDGPSRREPPRAERGADEAHVFDEVDPEAQRALLEPPPTNPQALAYTRELIDPRSPRNATVRSEIPAALLEQLSLDALATTDSPAPRRRVSELSEPAALPIFPREPPPMFDATAVSVRSAALEHSADSESPTPPPALDATETSEPDALRTRPGLDLASDLLAENRGRQLVREVINTERSMRPARGASGPSSADHASGGPVPAGFEEAVTGMMRMPFPSETDEERTADEPGGLDATPRPPLRAQSFGPASFGELRTLHGSGPVSAVSASEREASSRRAERGSEDSPPDELSEGEYTLEDAGPESTLAEVAVPALRKLRSSSGTATPPRAASTPAQRTSNTGKTAAASPSASGKVPAQSPSGKTAVPGGASPSGKNALPPAPEPPAAAPAAPSKSTGDALATSAGAATLAKRGRVNEDTQVVRDRKPDKPEQTEPQQKAASPPQAEGAGSPRPESGSRAAGAPHKRPTHEELEASTRTTAPDRPVADIEAADASGEHLVIPVPDTEVTRLRRSRWVIAVIAGAIAALLLAVMGVSMLRRKAPAVGAIAQPPPATSTSTTAPASTAAGTEAARAPAEPPSEPSTTSPATPEVIRPTEEIPLAEEDADELADDAFEIASSSTLAEDADSLALMPTAVRIRAFPRAAKITVDGVAIANGGSVILGDHPKQVRVSCPGYDDQAAVLEPGRLKPLDVVLKKKGAAPRRK